MKKNKGPLIGKRALVMTIYAISATTFIEFDFQISPLLVGQFNRIYGGNFNFIPLLILTY